MEMKITSVYLGCIFPWCKSSLVCLSVILLTISEPLSAQALGAVDPAERAAREHEQRLKQEELRREDELRRNRQEADIFLQEDEPEQDSWVGDDEARCFDIHEIRVHGVTLFAAQQISDITDAYLGECLGINDFNTIVGQISNLYLAKGYVTSRAYIQPQNLRDGLLEVLVVEGRLESLVPVDSNLTPRQLRWAFPVKLERPLNLRELEQGLENLNRLKQNNAAMDLEPGEQPGYTSVRVNNQRSRRLSGGLGFNNSGSKATGETLGTAHVSWDNPLGSNDNIYLSFSDAIDAPTQAKSQSYSFSYTIPHGYALYRLSTSSFEYQQLVTGSAVDFITSGSSASQSLSLDYLIYRGQKDKFTIAPSLTRKESKNYLEDVFLETSSRTLYLMKLGMKYTRQLTQGFLRGELAWVRSEDWFDATEKLVAAERDFQFDKYMLDVSFSRSISMFNKPFNYQNTLSLFYTPDTIIASEALSLGGQYTVRGLDGGGLMGYSGGYWRNEISKRIFSNNFGSTTITTGLDIGNTDTPEYEEFGREWLAGVVVGIAYSSQYFSLDLTYAEGVRSPDYIDFNKHSVYASLQAYF